MVPVNRNTASDERRQGRGRRGNILLDQYPETNPNSTDNREQEQAGSVLRSEEATTKAGKPRRRMTWTREMNINVMRCYYKSTNIETNKTGYREDLHRLFIEIYPQYANLTQQRVVDQKRSIVTNNRLTSVELQNIKEEIAKELQNDNQDNNNNTAIELQCMDHIELQNNNLNNNNSPNVETTSTIPNPNNPICMGCSYNNSEENIAISKYEKELQEQLIKWQDIEPENRYKLPKLKYNKNTRHLMSKINSVLERYASNLQTISETHLLIYAAATITILNNNQKIYTNNIIENKKYKNKPKWEIRLENKINSLRKNIGRLTQYISGKRSKKLITNIEHIIPNHKENIYEVMDKMKQQLSVYAKRLKRYKESNDRHTHNKKFNNNQRQFFKDLTQDNSINMIPPSKYQIEDFWKSIWSHTKTIEEDALWIKTEEQNHLHIPQQIDHSITTHQLTNIIKRTHNWKAPGTDHIHNFWYKQFTAIHSILATQINYILTKPEELPKFLTHGKTFILPKNSDTQNPKNYRPITCLPTLYKIITSVIMTKVEKHINQHNILSEEQKGCRKNSQGCKEQLIIDSVIMKQIEKSQRNLITCYIDYKKAFDSIPHLWLQKVLEIYKIDLQIQNFLKIVMQSWRTTIYLNDKMNQIKTNEIKINTGIFQGDSLSALWFCLGLNPISNALKNTQFGFHIKHNKQTLHKINHLLYMDDIKIYAPNLTQMQSILNIVEKTSASIGMEFGIEKCKLVHIERGKLKLQPQTETLDGEILNNMQAGETYKYLGFEQNTKINHGIIKSQLKNAYRHRLKLILKTQLNALNTFKAINTFAIPILSYSFGIIKWTATDLEELNRLTRTTLTKHRYLHPNSCKERITIKRKEGGRGLIDTYALHNSQIKNLREYFYNQETQLHKAIAKSDDNYTPLNLKQENITTQIITTETKKQTWKQKPIHGKHINIMLNNRISTELSYKWLTQGRLFPETEGFLLAIQDGIIATKNYRKHILKENIDSDLCRKCYQQRETIEHIVSGCPILAGTEYTERHNLAAKIIHQQLAFKYKLTENTNEPYYKYTPQNVMENEEVKLYWDRVILTDVTVASNRPDITLINKKQKETYLIDIAVPNDNNLIQKEQEKISKYTPIAIEIKQLWRQQKVNIVPIIISATGLTATTFTNHIKTIELEQNIHHIIQRAIIMQTARITRKFLNQN